MVITTGTCVEGKTIVEYKSLVFGKSTASDLNLFLDKPKYQQLYADWVKKAEQALEDRAKEAGANAVIGVRQETIHSTGLMILMLIGTAVTVA